MSAQFDLMVDQSMQVCELVTGIDRSCRLKIGERVAHQGDALESEPCCDELMRLFRGHRARSHHRTNRTGEVPRPRCKDQVKRSTVSEVSSSTLASSDEVGRHRKHSEKGRVMKFCESGAALSGNCPGLRCLLSERLWRSQSPVDPHNTVFCAYALIAHTHAGQRSPVFHLPRAHPTCANLNSLLA